MKRVIDNINDLELECYLPDLTLEKSKLLVIISLGIPRNGPNNKLYTPGILFTQLQNRLAEQEINSCIVGVPGMGESGGDTFNTTLEQRTEHIEHLLKKNSSSKIWLIGYSMGAAVILLLLKRKIDQIKGVTLIAPASYPLGAENKKFGIAFKNELNYGTGSKLLYPQYFLDMPIDIDSHLLAAQSDKVIPDFIIQSFQNALELRKQLGANAHFTRIPNASHNLTDGSWGVDMIITDIITCIGKSNKLRPKI